MIVEQHRTLAAPMPAMARGGWISGGRRVITYHKDFGEAGRITVSYEHGCKTEGFSDIQRKQTVTHTLKRARHGN